MILKIKLWWKHFRHPSIVYISHSGQRTSFPQVHVSVHGPTGTQSVYTFEANSSGEAKATMYGRGLAEIMRRKLVDMRVPGRYQGLK